MECKKQGNVEACETKHLFGGGQTVVKAPNGNSITFNIARDGTQETALYDAVRRVTTTLYGNQPGFIEVGVNNKMFGAKMKGGKGVFSCGALETEVPRAMVEQAAATRFRAFLTDNPDVTKVLFDDATLAGTTIPIKTLVADASPVTPVCPRRMSEDVQVARR